MVNLQVLQLDDLISLKNIIRSERNDKDRASTIAAINKGMLVDDEIMKRLEKLYKN